MRRRRKNPQQEFAELKERLRQLVQEHTDEVRRNEQLLLEAVRAIEDRLARLDSLQSERERIGERFRKRIQERNSVKRFEFSQSRNGNHGKNFESPSAELNNYPVNNPRAR